MQESQIMFTVPLPPLFAMLYLIALILLILGTREHQDIVRRTRFLKMGGVLLGFTTILLGFLWYATQPELGFLGYVEMRLADLLVLAGTSAIGGIIIGLSARI